MKIHQVALLFVAAMVDVTSSAVTAGEGSTRKLGIAGQKSTDNLTYWHSDRKCKPLKKVGKYSTKGYAGADECYYQSIKDPGCFDHGDLKFINIDENTLTCYCHNEDSECWTGNEEKKGGWHTYKLKAKPKPPTPTDAPKPKPTDAPKPVASASGDPHFTLWDGNKFDFHGGCDLVLLQNNQFANGLGMNIHIRTSIRTWWSYIESAILKIGDNTLQITGGKNKATYSINGAEMSELVTGDAALGDYAISFRQVNDHHTITRIDLGNAGDAIGIETFKDFVRVSTKDVKTTSFNGSMGLLGSYPSGAKIGRDGNTVFKDTNEFGQEWMVKPTDAILFPDVDAAELPLKCQMPDEMQRKEGLRRLGEGSISEEDAGLACAHVSDHDFDACVFDVMATQDKDMAGSY